MRKYPRLFEPIKIGKMELKNRIAMTPMGLPLAQMNGEPTDDYTAYYEERAKGGEGLIITGIAIIDNETGIAGTHQPMLINMAVHKLPFQRFVRAIHKHDAKVIMQIYHPGKETVSMANGGRVVAPSELITRYGEKTHALTVEEIQVIVKKFINGAQIVQAAEADGVEVHCAHGYLLNEFMTPLFNKRTDEYGGSFENRMRIVKEIIEGIQKACPGFPITVRISADEFMEGGNTIDDYVEIAKYLEGLGIDAINISAAVQENSQFNREPASFQQGWKKHLAKNVKDAVSIPVIAVNTIKKPDFAESLLEEGVCDIIGLSRPHLADPEWANKSRDGREDEIRSCISCLVCFESLALQNMMQCSVNPRCSREREYSCIKKNGAGRPVVVIGGGPAGMEAAALLAERGFDVTLFEQGSELGGQLNYAEKPPLKEKISWTKENMISRVNKANVKIMLNTEANVQNVGALNPVAVFVGCGSEPVRPTTIPGIMNPNVYTVPEVLGGKVDLAGKKIAMVGSGLAGLETAVFLANKGCKLTVVEMKDEIGQGLWFQTFNDVMNELKKYGPDAEVLAKHKLLAINDKGIEVENANGGRVEFEAEAIVLAMGVKPRREVVDAMRQSFDSVYLLGDAVKDGRIVDATRDGYGKAWAFDSACL